MSATIHHITPAIEQRKAYLKALKSDFSEDVDICARSYATSIATNETKAYKFKIVHDYITKTFDLEHTYFKIHNILIRQDYSFNDAAWLMENIPKYDMIMYIAYHEYYGY